MLRVGFDGWRGATTAIPTIWEGDMGLMKPPGLITFLIAVLLAAGAVAAKAGLVPVAGIAPFAFWILLVAFVLLMLGAITRGL